jgi:hypothetical protein
VAVTQYITRAKLTTRLGAEGLAKLASASGVLDAEAQARVDQACTDVNGRIDAAVGGLDIDVSTIPEELEEIAARLVKPVIHAAAWNEYGVPTPKSMLDEAKGAESDLKALQSGDAKIAGAAARQVVSTFSWRNVADCPSDDNPRQTTRSRMRRLP